MAFDHTITAGTTSKIVEIMVRDSTTGAGKTGIAFGSVTASYVREGSTRTAITLASGAAGDSYSSGKWAEVDATNCKGLYQLHVPNAAIDTGANAVTIQLQASGVIDKTIRIALIGVDLRDAAAGGMSRIDENVSAAKTLTTGERSSVASAVRTNLATELARIDENVSAAKTLTTGERTSVASAVRTNLAVELARIDENISAAKSLTVGERSSVAAAVRTNLAVELARIDENTSAAKTLTTGERTSIAVAVASDILNDGDGTAVLQAIADQIAADWIAGDASAVAIAAAVRTNLATELARIDENISAAKTLTTGERTSVAAAVRTDLTTELARIDEAVSAAKTLTTGERTSIAAAVRTDLTTELGRIDENVSAAKTLTSGERSAISTQVDTDLTTAHGAGSWAAGGGLTLADIADAVWDEILSGHAIAGSTGEALNAAGGAGDPWITSLPGGYGAGTAGYLVGVLLAMIESQTSQITADGLTVAGPVQPGGAIALTVGDDYETAIAHQIDRDVTDADQSIYDTLTDADVTAVKFAAGYGKTADVIVGTIDKAAIAHAAGVTTIPIEVPSANLANVDHLKAYIWQIQTTETGGRKRTVLQGALTINADMAA